MTIWELIALAKSGSGGASSVFHFKGSVLNESSLPDSGEEGDVYLVDSADSYFAWDGEGWTDIGQLLTADEAQKIIADVSNEVSDLKSAINFLNDIPGTVQTVNFDANGNPSSIVHTANGEAVRTDSFTWGDNTVTEKRELADGSYITFVTNLTTLVTTISEIQEA